MAQRIIKAGNIQNPQLETGAPSGFWQAWDPGRADVSVRIQKQEKKMMPPYPLLLVDQPSSQAFNWLGEAHSRGRAICCTQSTNSNVNRHTQNNVWPNVWALHGPVKLIHKINYHTWQGTISITRELSARTLYVKRAFFSSNSFVLFFLPALLLLSTWIPFPLLYTNCWMETAICRAFNQIFFHTVPTRSRKARRTRRSGNRFGKATEAPTLLLCLV